MEIKKFYLGIFRFGDDVFNHMLQMEDGTWYFTHIPKTRKITDADMTFVPTKIAARYAEDGDELNQYVIDRNYRQTGLVLV